MTDVRPLADSPTFKALQTRVTSLEQNGGGGSSGPAYWSAIIGKPTTIAGYGITDAQSATGAIAWSRITGSPTTRAGYGIVDAQPLDGDLTSLAAASAIGLYYRAAVDTWSPVTIGANLTFSGGTLSASGGSSGGGGDMFKADNLSGLGNNATALTNLGGTTVGRSVFTAVDAAAARSAIGAGTGSGTVTSVSGTAPIVSSGGATPAISITPATPSAAGSLSASDKTKLDAISGTNTGDQTSVTGNAGTATKLATARNINGVAFDGTGNITVSAVDTATPRLALTHLPLSVNFTAAADAYIPARVTQTIAQGNAPIGTGTLAYAKSTAAAPSTFTTTTLPATLEAGAWLKVSATSVTGFLAADLYRSA